MTRFVAVVDVAAPVERTWDLIVDWPSHARWVPLTTMRVLTASPGGVGARFVARSGIGPIGFDDPMEITEWSPPEGARPGRCGVVKLGRVVTGRAAFDVARVGEGRSVVVWEEDIDIAPARLTRWFAPVVSLAGRVAFTQALRRMAAELAVAHAGTHGG